jgi:hypothetical protein
MLPCLPAAAANQKWERARTLQFNGGAIVDFYPASRDSAIVLAAMPDGFSIYSLDFASGGIVKLVSQTYLQSLVPDSSDADDLRILFDPNSGLLMLKPQAGKLAPLLINLSLAPSLTRYTLGLPDGYEIGASVFASGKLYFSPTLECYAGGSPGLLVFDPKSKELSQLKPGRKLALVDELFYLPEKESLLMLGRLDTFADRSHLQLAWISSDGGVEPIFGTEKVLRAAVCPGAIAYILAAEEKAAPSDVSPLSFRLVVFPSDMSANEKKSLLLNAEPAWLGLGERGETALIMAETSDAYCDLWAVDTTTRSRERMRDGVLAARMSPDCSTCIVLPAENNQLELYTPKTAGL